MQRDDLVLVGKSGIERFHVRSDKIFLSHHQFTDTLFACARRNSFANVITWVFHFEE